MVYNRGTKETISSVKRELLYMTLDQISQTIQDLSTILLPLLPYFTKGVKSFGGELVKSAGGKVGENIPEVIKTIWNKLLPKITENQDAEKVVKEIVENPKDQHAIGEFKLILKDILLDKELRSELTELVQEVKNEKITIEQITHIGNNFGKVINVDIENLDNFPRANIKSELTVNENKTGGEVTSLRIRNIKK
jgi:hypothetical protein